jgi:hypothetical protein
MATTTLAVACTDPLLLPRVRRETGSCRRRAGEGRNYCVLVKTN